MDRKSRQRHESLAHLLEYVLGKGPDEFGLALDPEGWVSLKSLVQALSEEPDWRGLTQNRILDLGWALPEAPFEIEEKRIRLQPDHPSALESPRREPAPTPSTLYYGSRRKPYPVYIAKGIRLAEEEVVLTREKAMALRIASRREPKPIPIEVSTKVAAEMGVRFYGYGKNLFVADWLPKEALSGPPIKEEKPPAKLKPKKRIEEKGSPQAPRPESFHSRPWKPEEDTLLSRDLDSGRKKLREERGRKKVGWKEEARRGKRKRSKAEDKGHKSKPKEEV
jgi:putative RNA 2'-phosphotransferase